ncbi:hypothetical protein AGMMS49965_14620 [Bacteroidia bacterium]|nr:hypothetical protein AGMMS49965_14620 [Bacteroidia bacterium]
MKKYLMILVATACLGFNVHAQQIRQMSLYDYVVIHTYLTNVKDGVWIDHYPIVGSKIPLYTSQGVKKIKIKRYSAKVSFGEINKEENTMSVLPIASYDGQGRLTALDGAGLHKRLKWDADRIVEITTYTSTGELSYKNFIASVQYIGADRANNNGNYWKQSNDKYTKEGDGWIADYSKRDYIFEFKYEQSPYDKKTKGYNRALATIKIFEYEVFSPLGIYSRHYSFDKSPGGSESLYTHEITLNGKGELAKVIFFRGEIKDEQPLHIFEYEYEY